MQKEMTIYRSSEGKQHILDLYDKTVRHLGIKYEDHMIDTRFGQTHIIIAGPVNAPPVVVLPGGNEYAPNTLRNLISFCDHFRVYAVDTIGHPGKSVEARLSMDDSSYGEWLLDVLNGLELKSVNIFCGSYSASIAYRLAAINPEKISRLALVSPSGLANGSAITFLRKLFIPWIIYRMAPNRSRLIRAIDAIISDTDENFLDFLEATLKYVKIRMPTPRTITAEEMLSFKAPTMVFCQSKDILYPPEKVIPRARAVFQNLVSIEILDGVHSPTKEQFDHISERVTEFFKSH
ncbi:MAG: alpha/beta hydrolase [Candidatus Thorarchaeota archaeon]